MLAEIKYDQPKTYNPDQLAKDNIDYLSLSLVPLKVKVLELGCATGYMGRYLTTKRGCQVIGVDINPAVKPIISGDLNLNSTWLKIKQKGPYDVVFASAILEHLPQPEATLQLIKSVLKPKGKLIVTLPNISHWRQRWERLIGRFEYEAYGQLDRTHLRFFNYWTSQKLLTDAGFKIKTIKIDPAGGMKYFNWLVKRWPNLSAHQIAYEAIKR